MSFRSVRMMIFNMTTSPFDRVAVQIKHGEITSSFPPPLAILPGQGVEWRVESGGSIPIVGSILTGTEGSVDYEVRGKGDKIHFAWDNPAELSNTSFDFEPVVRADGSTSDYVFFATHLAFDMSVEPDPISGPPIVAVTRGDDGDETFSLILPFPGQEQLYEHAWFAAGIRNRREPISLREWLIALRLDPSKGVRQLQIKNINIRQLVELQV